MSWLYRFVPGPVALSVLSACTLDVSGMQTTDEQADLVQGDAGGGSGAMSGPALLDQPDAAGGGQQAHGDPMGKDAAGLESKPEGAHDAGTDGGAGSVGGVAHVVDGETPPGEWERAVWSYQSVDSDWGKERNTLRSLAVAVDADFVWLRVEGLIELANAIVVYVDSVPAAGKAPSELTDRLGLVDDAISCGVSTPAGRAPDFAWATRVTDGSGTLIGPPSWRGLSSASDLTSIDDTQAPSVCKQGVCETRIARATLQSKGPLFVFARLVNATGDLLSNQALPVQPGTPTTQALAFVEVAP